jgi:hypothetical protein
MGPPRKLDQSATFSAVPPKFAVSKFAEASLQSHYHRLRYQAQHLRSPHPSFPSPPPPGDSNNPGDRISPCEGCKEHHCSPCNLPAISPVSMVMTNSARIIRWGASSSLQSLSGKSSSSKACVRSSFNKRDSLTGEKAYKREVFCSF